MGGEEAEPPAVREPLSLALPGSERLARWRVGCQIPGDKKKLGVRLWGHVGVEGMKFPLCICPGYICHTPFWEPRFGGQIEGLA